MEVKTRLVLKHQNGPYLSWDRDQYPHTWKLSNARRFYKMEEVVDFLENSYYKPEHPEKYEVVEVEIEYRLKEETQNVQQIGDDRQDSISSSQV